MRYPDRLSNEHTIKYLDRLEVSEHFSADLHGLNHLLFAQLTHIPFDSLDVWGDGGCPSLVLEDIYQKIVLNGRGGYCFELNTLFRSLLNAMGFDVYQAIACILNPDGTPQPPAHNVILCNLQDKRYFLDVGYGGPVPYRALELKEGLQDGFLLEKREDFWYVTRVTEKETRPLICFRDIPVSVNDLIPLNFYISQRPDVHFRHVIHLSFRNADGSIYSLDGREFKIHGGNDTTIIPVDSIDKLKEIMKTYFSIDPDTVPLRTEI